MFNCFSHFFIPCKSVLTMILQQGVLQPNPVLLKLIIYCFFLNLSPHVLMYAFQLFYWKANIDSFPIQPLYTNFCVHSSLPSSLLFQTEAFFSYKIWLKRQLFCNFSQAHCHPLANSKYSHDKMLSFHYMKFYVLFNLIFDYCWGSNAMKMSTANIKMQWSSFWYA